MKIFDLWTVGRGIRTHVIKSVEFSTTHDTGMAWANGNTLCGNVADSTCVPTSYIHCAREHRNLFLLGRVEPSCRTCLRIETGLRARMAWNLSEGGDVAELRDLTNGNALLGCARRWGVLDWRCSAYTGKKVCHVERSCWNYLYDAQVWVEAMILHKFVGS